MLLFDRLVLSTYQEFDLIRTSVHGGPYVDCADCWNGLVRPVFMVKACLGFAVECLCAVAVYILWSAVMCGVTKQS